MAKTDMDRLIQHTDNQAKELVKTTKYAVIIGAAINILSECDSLTDEVNDALTDLYNDCLASNS